MTLIPGCSRQDDSAVRRRLPGAWTFAADYENGHHSKITIKVDPNGDYVCQVVGASRTSNLAGTFEVRDGVLIDTVTKISNTNLVTPRTYRARIVRSDGRELVLKYEANNPGTISPTNELVLRKEER